MESAVAYIRKSSQEENRQVESFEGQRRVIQGYADKHDIEIIHWYTEAFTGTEVAKRKEFIAMLDTAENKTLNFKYVLCYDISRFGRLDNDEAGYYRHRFRQCGIEVVYIQENLQGDDTDDLIVSTKQWLAREYSRKIADYVARNIITRSQKAAMAKRAFSIGRRAPFGYDTVYLDEEGDPHTVVRQMLDGSKQVYDMDGNLLRTLAKGVQFQKASTDLNGLIPSAEDRVETVRKIFHLYVHKNKGQRAIAEILNKEMQAGTGLPSAMGKPWAQSSVTAILTNEHYIGTTIFNKRSMGKFFKIKDGEAKKLPRFLRKVVRPNDRKDWIVIPDTHEPLIDNDTFRQAQLKRKEKRRDGSVNYRRSSSPYLFSGKLHCADCGYHFHGKVYRKKNWSRTGYICGGYKLHGATVCGQHFLPEDVLLPPVLEALQKELEFFNWRDTLAVAKDRLESTPEVEAMRREKTETQIQQVQAKMDNLFACITPATKDMISEKLVQLDEHKKALEAELNGMDGASEEVKTSSGLVRRLVEIAKEFNTLWAQAKLEEKREFLSLFIESVSIRPKGKTAVLHLQPQYLRAKELHEATQDDSVPFKHRGDWIRTSDLSVPNAAL